MSVIAIDQGTTSSRAIRFGPDLAPEATAQEEFEQYFPASGWVEHEAADLWETTRRVTAEVMDSSVRAIGITNQRETTVVWDRRTGEPIHRAIVWQDRRTADRCAALKKEGLEERATEVTGLLLDPYFSGTKLAWILDEVEGARERAEAGELLFGTVDTWLIWNLTEGRVHATDHTNACRTLLYDIRAGDWSDEMLEMLDVPRAVLPEIRDCDGDFGETTLFGDPVPIRGVAGDQQAATVGQACFEPGMLKSTYGTGCFALLNTGDAPQFSKSRLLTTVAYRLGGRTTYALEGAIFIAGAAVQWLRDGLGIVEAAHETARMAARADPKQDVLLVPAFTGLGAPHWVPEARGALFGLTRGTGRDEVAKAALESVGYQTLDLIRAMQADHGGDTGAVIRVDGGMTASDPAMQFLADITGGRVDRPTILETTALGVAWIAGHAVGLYPGAEGFAARWALDRSFEPAMDEAERAARTERWDRAVAATRGV
ncbi:glycerol kinase [Hasllibacter halocynthiae]|uniref:glycerol kinase n=1 Tax=Hasllibacter halocynthiae TaxID=595589 RepID=A0A2T0X3V7_9RHOB|nr:glycerol kinase GlpK [Hasllibacter halocynthiae]PRY93585.1 glycerol kinase [Hasllibacter halocynthiae]